MLMKLSKKDSKKVQKVNVWKTSQILTQMNEENNNSQDFVNDHYLLIFR